MKIKVTKETKEILTTKDLKGVFKIIASFDNKYKEALVQTL